ncbi:NUDIX hydrolase [Polymorphobacter sp. PAMC 29334]|nr:NUDIX hydrolase [Polymorphobacter sp. PAMC 29334]
MVFNDDGTAMADLLWQGKYLEVRRDGTWEYAARVGGMGAAVILAVTDAREIVLVEQLRRALGKPTIELPAGLIGDDGDFDAAAAAARELDEETGFTATGWERIGDFATSPGMSSEMFTLFRASGLKQTGSGGGVAGEDITVHVVPLDGIGDWLAVQRGRGCVIDCRLIAALGLV